MFASESSHASSFKNSWICVSSKPQPTKKCTTRIHALGSDDATSLEKKRRKKRQKHVLQIKNTHFDCGSYVFLCWVWVTRTNHFIWKWGFSRRISFLSVPLRQWAQFSDWSCVMSVRVQKCSPALGDSPLPGDNPQRFLCPCHLFLFGFVYPASNLGLRHTRKLDFSRWSSSLFPYKVIHYNSGIHNK